MVYGLLADDRVEDDIVTGTDSAPSHLPVLLMVVLKTDQPNIERRLRVILAAAEPVEPDTEAVAWAKRLEDLVAADLDALASLVGYEAVARLRVGDVAEVEVPTPHAGAGSGDAPAAASDTRRGNNVTGTDNAPSHLPTATDTQALRDLATGWREVSRRWNRDGRDWTLRGDDPGPHITAIQLEWAAREIETLRMRIAS